MMNVKRLAPFALLVTGVLTAQTARADSFDVRPIMIETRDGLGLIVVSNPGDRRIYLESQVLEWSQDGSGTDHMVESETAIASPPAMWVPPHSSYTMRVRLPAGAPSTERAFRVVIKQLPERSDIAGGRVVFALTQNLPAFVVPINPSAPSIEAQRLDAARILLQNSGGRRVRVTGISQDGRVLASGLLGYSLARGAVAIKVNQPFHTGTIDVETDLGRRTVTLR